MNNGISNVFAAVADAFDAAQAEADAINAAFPRGSEHTLGRTYRVNAHVTVPAGSVVEIMEVNGMSGVATVYADGYGRLTVRTNHLFTRHA